MAGSFELATRNSSAWLPNPVSLSSDKTGVLLLVSHQQAAEKHNPVTVPASTVNPDTYKVIHARSGRTTTLAPLWINKIKF